MTKNEIAAYIAPYDLFHQEIPKGTLYFPQGGKGNTYCPSKMERYGLPKEIVETWEPLYEFKRGKWVCLREKDPCSYWKIGEVAMIENPQLRDSYLVREGGETQIVSNKYLRLATEDEIKETLIQQAVRRGFLHLAEFIGVRDTRNEERYGANDRQRAKVGKRFEYIPETDTLYTLGWGAFILYEKGAWGTLKPDTADKLIKITLHHSKGLFELEISKKGIYYRPDDSYLNLEELNMALSNHHVGRKYESTGCTAVSYLFQPSAIDSGCMKGVPIGDWRRVIDEYHTLVGERK